MYEELKHTAFSEGLFYSSSEQFTLTSFRILIPKHATHWAVSLQCYLHATAGYLRMKMDSPPTGVSNAVGEDTRTTFKRLLRGEELIAVGVPNSGGIAVSTYQKDVDAYCDTDRWLYVQAEYPGGALIKFQSTIYVDNAAVQPIPPMQTTEAVPATNTQANTMQPEDEYQQQAAALLPAVDLRSYIDRVYNQGSTGACGPHALVNALDTMYDNAGQSKRFSRAWLYWWANEHAGHQYQDIGTDLAGLAYAVTQHGLALESDWPWDNVHVKPTATVLGETRVELKKTLWNITEVKRLLCLGVPVVMAFNVVTDFYNLRDKRNWKEHTWDVFGNVGQTDHWVCIVGYDDAAERFLVENSWGADWGDGGFFGMPYSYFNKIYSMAFHVDRIANFQPKKEEGFMSIPYMLNTTDNSDFTFRNKANMINILTSALNSGGIQAVIDACIAWNISDKHLEYLFKWERGAVRAYQEANPALNWNGFIFSNL